MLRAFLAVVLAAAWCCEASAAPIVQTPNGPQFAQPFYMVDPNGNPVSSGGSSSGGTVAQGAPGSSAWLTSDASNAAFQGVVSVTPGTATTALRSLGFVCTASGNITLTLADTSTITLPITASSSFQTLPFAVTNVALGTGTTGTFWNLK